MTGLPPAYVTNTYVEIQPDINIEYIATAVQYYVHRIRNPRPLGKSSATRHGALVDCGWRVISKVGASQSGRGNHLCSILRDV
jgi:hypothetical protein